MAKPLDNPRHEAFAQAFAGGMSASDAYVEAGYRRYDGVTDQDALTLEAGTIRLISFDRQTNARPGEYGEIERHKRFARLALQQIKDFDDWCREKPRKEWEREMFRSVVRAFQDIAEHGYLSEIQYFARVRVS